MKVEKDDTGNCMSVDREVQMLEDLKKVPGIIILSKTSD